jgi:hypothetical protein
MGAANSKAWGQLTDGPTQPLPLVSGPRGVLAAQLARFGELAGRDLSARASAALRAGRAHDPRRRDEERACPPLTADEHQEMAALHAAITGAQAPADAGSAAAEGQSGPDNPPRPPRLRRRSPPGPARSAGRHHRPAGLGAGYAAVHPAWTG